MSKDPDKKDIHSDAHDTLVKSLESIKDLLLKSESKISAARESIAKAGMSGQPATDEAVATDPEPEAAEEQVPLFDLANPEVAEPAHTDPPPQPEVPLLDDVVAPGQAGGDDSPEAGAEPVKQETEGKPDLDLRALDEFQAIMEEKIHRTVVQAIIKLEARFKSQLEKEIARLRRKLEGRH